ncbi:hypothetical protein ACFE04_010335 [Oxalis oulophora]
MNSSPDSRVKFPLGLQITNPNGSDNDAEAEAKQRASLAEWLNTIIPNLSLPVKATDEELRACLADGTVLCRILNRLKPGSVNEAGDSEVSSVSRSENVGRFLAAMDELELPRFDIANLEKGSMKMVISCLMTLRAQFVAIGDNFIALSSPRAKCSSPRWDSSSRSPTPIFGEDKQKFMSDPNFQRTSRSTFSSGKGVDARDVANMSYICGFTLIYPNAKYTLWFHAFTLLTDSSAASMQHGGHKFHEVFQLKQGRYADLPAAKISEMMKSNSLDNAPTQSLLSVVNGILDESVEKKNGEIPHRVACLLRKVVQEIERRISTQSEHLRTQNKMFKAREEKYQSRIKVLEALASGASEEAQVVASQIQHVNEQVNQIQQVTDQVNERVKNVDNSKLEELKKLEENAVRLTKEKEQYVIQISELTKEKEQYDVQISEVKKKFEDVKESHEQHCLRMETETKNAKANLEKRIEELECLLKDSSSKMNQLESHSTGSSTKVNDLESRLVDSSSKVNVLESRLVDSSTKVIDLESRLVDSSSKVKELEGHLTSSSSKVKELENNLVDSSTKVKALEGNLADSNSKVKELESNLVNSSTKVKNLETNLVDSSTKVKELEYNLTDSNTKVKKLESNLLDSSTKVKELEGRLVDTSTRVKELETYSESINLTWSRKHMGYKKVMDSQIGVLQGLRSSSVFIKQELATTRNNYSQEFNILVTVHVRGKDLKTGSGLHGNLHLVDLAGSERIDRSEVTGDRLKEAQHINKSLSALGDVIFALAQKSAHVPYRNSKLTQILQTSLGGQAKTLMFVQLNPDLPSFSESLSTLKFAERVSGVELGTARSSKEGRDVKELMDQVASLKDTIAKKDEEIERLQLVKSVSPRINGERRGTGSPLRYASSSPKSESPTKSVDDSKHQNESSPRQLKVAENNGNGDYEESISSDGTLSVGTDPDSTQEIPRHPKGSKPSENRERPKVASKPVRSVTRPREVASTTATREISKGSTGIKKSASISSLNKPPPPSTGRRLWQ